MKYILITILLLLFVTLGGCAGVLGDKIQGGNVDLSKSHVIERGPESGMNTIIITIEPVLPPINRVPINPIK